MARTLYAKIVLEVYADSDDIDGPDELSMSDEVYRIENAVESFVDSLDYDERLEVRRARES
jgi:hypothetical protein